MKDPRPALSEWTRRVLGSLRPSRSDADLEEELRLHLALAAEEEQRRGLTPMESERAARVRSGAMTQALATLRDQRGLPALDALAADLVFGWRQLVRHRTASLATILSLGLAMGATLAAFRLVDALLLRPLHVADPSQLFAMAVASHDIDGRAEDRDDFDYPTFQKYVAALEHRADVMLVGMAVRRPVRIEDGEPEQAVQQFVSGNVFSTLGLRPALGRLLGTSDDVTPDGHPVAMISHEFWRRRFAGDRAVIGRTFHLGTRAIEIVGVTPAGFTGTEPGALTDFFLPATMNAGALDKPGWTWFRIWLRPRKGVNIGELGALLQAQFHADQIARAKRFAPDTPQWRVDAFLAQRLELQPAGSGVSGMQRFLRRPLWILAALAALLLLIACANVANLLLARAMSRRTEMALRVSIGAARGRLIQLLLIESALLASLASAAGALFAIWAAPFVVGLLAPEERPVRLVLDLDWRTFVLATLMTLCVTMLFGLAPAVRASAVAPIGTLKATHSRQRRLTEALIAVQMAFCVFLLFGAALFLGTFKHLQDKPLGFDPDRLIHMNAESRTKLTAGEWEQLAARLRDIPRVESAALAAWAPLTGNRWRWAINVDGRPSEPSPNWVSVSPGYFQTMRMRLIEGREFRSGDLPPDANRQPGAAVAIVNQSFARAYFGGRSPVGRRVTVTSDAEVMEIVGMAADAVYFSVRETMHPAVFVPLEPARNGVTVMVRTTDGGADLRNVIGREIARIRPEVVVRDAAPFEAFVTQQMIRERLLAALSTFFGGLALVLAIIGIYGVLNYAVTRERRDISLRMALGARPSHVLTLLTGRLMAVVGAGALVGIGGGFAFTRTVRTLLFEMEPTDPQALLAPILALAAAAGLSAIGPAMRAVRIDPAQALKSEG